jgi:hypothetical protein
LSRRKAVLEWWPVTQIEPNAETTPSGNVMRTDSTGLSGVSGTVGTEVASGDGAGFGNGTRSTRGRGNELGDGEGAEVAGSGEVVDAEVVAAGVVTPPEVAAGVVVGPVVRVGCGAGA